MTVLLALLHYAAWHKMQTSFINLLSEEAKRYLNMYTRENRRIADDEGIVFVECLQGISVLPLDHAIQKYCHAQVTMCSYCFI